MSQETSQIPTVEIPFLYGDTPIPAYDMTNPAHLAEIEASEDSLQDTTRLYGWLTLPMAAQLVNKLLVAPLTQEGVDEGLNMARNDYFDTDLAETVAKVRKKMLGGTALPPFVHIIDDPSVNDPEEAARLTVLVPKTQDKRVQNIFDLRGSYKTLSTRGYNKGNPLYCVTVLPEFNLTKNKEAADTKLIVPGTNSGCPEDAASAEDIDKVPVAGVNTLNQVYRHGTVSGVRF